MNRKKKIFKGGLAYSTEPDLQMEEHEEAESTLPAEEQQLSITLDTKHRKGKTVTLIEGFIGTKTDLSTLSKRLKSYCGTGGSAKNGHIIIQGDVREKVKAYLEKEGFGNSQ